MNQHAMKRRVGVGRFSVNLVAFVTMVNLILQPVAVGATQYWDSNGATAGAGVTPTGTWGTDSFWSTDSTGASATGAWIGGDDAVFSAGADATGSPIITLNGSQAANSITVQEGTLTFTSGTLTINAGGVILNSGIGATIVNSAITLGAGQTWANNSGNTLTIGGGIDNGANLLTVGGTGNTTISGIIGTGSTKTGGLTKTGAGTLTLSGVNTYTGATRIDEGELVSNNGTAIPVDTAVTIGDGIGAAGTAKLRINAAMVGTTKRSVTIASDGVLDGRTNNKIVRFASISGTGGEWKLANNQEGTLSGTNGVATFSGTITMGGGGPTPPTPSSGVRFSMQGSYTQVLSGANTYASQTFISDGILRITHNTALGTASAAYANATLVYNTGTLDLSNNITVAERFYINGNGNGSVGALRNFSGVNTISGNVTIGWTVAGVVAADVSIGSETGTTLTISGAIDGANALTKVGGGTLTFSGANTYTGSTTCNSGTLTLDYSSQNNSKLSDAAALVLGGGTVNLTGGSHTEVVASTTVSTGMNGVTRASGSSVLQMGVITRNVGGTINFEAASIATTSSPNDAYGILGRWATIGGSDWAVNSTGGANGPITAYTGYTLTSVALDNPANYLNNNMDVDSSQSPAGAITSNSLRFNTAGSYTMTFTGANTITSGGILVTTTVGNNLSTVAGGSLAGPSGADLVITQNNTSNNLTVSSVIADNSGSGLTKTGAGTLILAGANTYTGATRVNGGTLAAGVVSVANTSGAFGNNSTVVMANVSDAILNITGYDTQVGSLTGGGTTGGNVTLGAATLTVGGDNTSPAAYAGVISGTGNLNKIGTGTLTLSGANTYTGTTTLTAGTVNLGSAETAGTSGPVGNSVASNAGSLILNGGTLQYSSSNVNDYSGRFSTAAGQKHYVDTNGQSVNWATALTSSGGVLTKSGTGALTLSGANTYAGATTVNAGTLKAGVASVANVSGAFGNNSAVTMANVATAILDITGYNTQIGSLTGGGTTGGNVTLGAATLTVGADNTSPAAYGGVISGTGGALTKIGTGTMTLSKANTYTGATTVNAGTLLVNSPGSLIAASAVTVNNGGTLGGSGTINGTVNVVSGGHLAPGADGVTTSVGSLTMASGSSLDIGCGAGVSKVVVTGTVDITGATLAFTGAMPESMVITLIDNDGADPIVGTFADLPEGTTLRVNGVLYAITYVGGDGNDVALHDNFSGTVIRFR